MLDKWLSLIAPHHCCNCQKVGLMLCDDCKNHIIDQLKLSNNLIPNSVLLIESIEVPVYILAKRTGLIKSLVDNYKFKLCRELAVSLASLFKVGLNIQNRVIVPLPTTKKHNRQRGFDHMRLIAKELSQMTGWSVSNSLIRQHQNPQRGLSAKDRLTNAQSAFACRARLDSNLNYLLIDDVYTTGSSVKAAAAVLIASGVRNLTIMVICRQPDKNSLFDSRFDKISEL